MKKFFSHHLILAMAITTLLLVAASELMAQNWVQDGVASNLYAAGASGRIRMKSQNGQFTFANGGTALGTAITDRIPGTVEWFYTTAASSQSVQARYYMNLEMAGGAGTAGAKAIPTLVYVGGTYTAAGGDRTYTGWFYYDGTIAQVIFPENSVAGGTTNRYDNVELQNGLAGNAKSVATGTVVRVLNQLTNNASNAGGLLVSGSMYNGNVVSNSTITLNATAADLFQINLNTAASTIASNFTVTLGTLDILGATAAGEVTVNGAAVLAIANDVNAKLVLHPDSGLNIVSSITNGRLERDNWTFDATSYMRYQGAAGNQTFLTTNPTAASIYKYGNVEFSGGAQKDPETNATQPDIYMKGNLIVQGGNVILNNAVATGPILDMEGSGNASYPANPNNDVYVRGRMRRSGTIPTGTALVFNNAQTQITFATAPATDFTLDVHPGLAPNTKCSNYNAATDVVRTVRMSFNPVGGSISTMRVGYVASEFGGGAFLENRMRFFEGYDVTKTKERIVVSGNPATRSGAADPRWVNIVSPAIASGIDLVAANTAPDSLKQIATTSDIILGSSSLYITVADGRWTNPNTWDEGVVPSAVDDALVRHLCYTGIDGAAFGTGGFAADEPDGSDQTDNGCAANSITIQAADATFIRPCLIIGNDDATMGATRIFRTHLANVVGLPNAGIFNNNPTANVGNGDDKTAAQNIHGIWVMSPNGAKIPTLGTGILTNKGRVQNNGTVEIGQ